MCGIVAYMGPKAVESVLLVGLTRLEYRGYDSAGIAVLNRGEIQTRKEQGKIKDLENLLQAHPVEGNIGIGHTRWATHGEPNRKNAHPHIDNSRKIAVVHNGIIENHYELRRELIKEGYVFHSETDTEVIAHLLADKLKQHPQIEDAFYQTILKIQGRYSIVFLYDGAPHRVFFARDGSPLIYGHASGESFLASDIPAIVPLASHYYTIHNGEWGWITESGEMQLFNSKNTAISPKLERIDIEVNQVEKNGYDHFMLKEIYEQPDVMRRIIQTRLNGSDGKVLFPEKAADNQFLGSLSRIFITSAGTSWHAGLVGKMYLEHLAKITTEVDLASEFRYRNPIAGGDTKVIAVSQSGETADTLASIYQAKSKFIRVLSFVNNANSAIARESDAYVDLMAGVEIGVASTKAYTAELLNLLLYALFLSGIKWVIGKTERQKICDEIRLLPSLMEETLRKSEVIKQWAQNFKETKDFIFLGRALDYPTALEGALKLKEISYIHASGYAGGEFKHGPIALVTSDVPVVCIAVQSEIYEKMLSNIEEVKARGGKIIALYTEGDKTVPKLADYSLPMPKASPLLYPILNSIPLQLLAYHVAVARNCEPDQPRNLAKSVTVE